MYTYIYRAIYVLKIKAGSYFRQKINLAIQSENVASLLGSMPQGRRPQRFFLSICIPFVVKLIIIYIELSV